MSSIAKFLGSLVRFLLYPLTTSLSTIHRLFLYFYTFLPSTNRRHVANDAASVADRWVRELEEETGVIRESRLSDVGVATASGADAQAGPGPSTLSRRSENARADRALIPEFYLGSYESAMREAQKDTRLLCVVIVSEEHEDVPEFKRTTLIEPVFNKILKMNDFIVWGGDVRDYQASQAAQKLGATTYPFVAFIGLQPRRGSLSSSDAPVLTILSRHQGPSTPNFVDLPTSELGPTSSRTLCLHLTNSLLPRVTPFLARLRAAAADRLAQRRLREEQDAAFARAAEGDRARAAAKREEERRMREEIEMQELARAREEAERRRAQEERETREKNRLLWFRYARRSLLSPEATPGKGSIRIGVRFPDGRLQVRHFASTDSLTSLYVFVASQLIPKDLASSEDPSSPPPGFASGEAGVSNDCWSFKLASAYPRREVAWVASTPLSSIDGLKGGAQLVLETIPGRSLIPGSTQDPGDGDSDYDTEED